MIDERLVFHFQLPGMTDSHTKRQSTGMHILQCVKSKAYSHLFVAANVEVSMYCSVRVLSIRCVLAHITCRNLACLIAIRVL